MLYLLYLVFLLPAIIAWGRNSSSRTAITILSILNAFLAIDFRNALGIFFGLILLLWSIIGRTKERAIIIDEKTFNKPTHESSNRDELLSNLSKLADMKEKGLLSEEEYEQAKKKILK